MICKHCSAITERLVCFNLVLVTNIELDFENFFTLGFLVIGTIKMTRSKKQGIVKNLFLLSACSRDWDELLNLARELGKEKKFMQSALNILKMENRTSFLATWRLVNSQNNLKKGRLRKNTTSFKMELIHF